MVGMHPRCVASEMLSLNCSCRAETDFFFLFVVSSLSATERMLNNMYWIKKLSLCKTKPGIDDMGIKQLVLILKELSA